MSQSLRVGFLFLQMNSRQKVEASLRQLERERALLQHQSTEHLRKVEIEADRKRVLENEREHQKHLKMNHKAIYYPLPYQPPKCHLLLCQFLYFLRIM